MPKRPPTIAERLRSLWTQDTAPSSARAGATAARHVLTDKGSAFADRLRAAVAARH